MSTKISVNASKENHIYEYMCIYNVIYISLAKKVIVCVSAK